MPRLKLHAVFTNWMRQPIDNAADRMALARIVYGLFFLFYLSYTDIREIEPLICAFPLRLATP